jgi:dynein heavy chain
VYKFYFNVHCKYFRLEDGIQALEKEANIDFCRSMNRIIFDKIIEQDNSTFAFVSVPAVEEKPVPFKGKTIFI